MNKTQEITGRIKGCVAAQDSIWNVMEHFTSSPEEWDFLAMSRGHLRECEEALGNELQQLWAGEIMDMYMDYATPGWDEIRDI